MGRKPRLHIESGLYHIISRGNNHKNIFKEDNDYLVFMDVLEKLKEKTFFKLYAYCLMPNHIHLLIQIKDINTSIIMQRLLTSYTKYFNKKYDKTGHLFQGRYKSIICEKDSYLLELVRYIHLNPYRAGLVKKPMDWNWSSHSEYFGRTNRKVVEVKEILGILSNDFKQAIKRYSEFIREGSLMGKRKDYYPEEKMPYLGGDRFKEDLMLQHNDLMNKSVQKLNVITKISLNEIVDNICKEYDVSFESLCGKVRIKELVNARKEFIRNAIDLGHKSIEIAKFINCSQGYITKLSS